MASIHRTTKGKEGHAQGASFQGEGKKRNRRVARGVTLVVELYGIIFQSGASQQQLREHVETVVPVLP